MWRGALHTIAADPNESVPKLLFQAMLIAGRGRAVAAITPAEYAIPRAKALSGGKVSVQRLTAP